MKSSTLIGAFKKNKSIISKGVTFITDSANDIFLSYQALYKKALIRLYYFQELEGLQHGDKIIFQIEDNQDFVISFWACLMGGIIPVPLTFANNPEVINKLLNVWEIVGYSKVIMPTKLLRKIQKHMEGLSNKSDISYQSFEQCTLGIETIKDWEENNQNNTGQVSDVKPDDLAFIQFSSGSTGDPKGVMLSHKNILTNIYDISPASQWTENDKSLSWMPLTHDMGLIGLHLTPLVLQCDQYLMSTFLFAFYPLTWMQKVHELAITITSCPNFGYEHFLSFLNDEDFKDVDLSSLRIILNGAEPISYKVCQHFLDKLEPYNLRRSSILPVYGLAEGSLAITNNPLGEIIKTHHVNRNSLTMGSKITITEGNEDNNSTALVDLGTPVGQVKLDIRDDKGKSLPEETVGLVFIKGKNVMRGYFNNLSVTKALLSENGWFNTSDLGFLKDNRLTIIGRLKEILFINGQNYYANDIERVANEVKGVEMGKVGVCGIENSKNGCDDIYVFVQHKKHPDDFVQLAQEVKQIIAKQTGITVKAVVPVKKMPVTTSGKVQRFILKENFLKGLYDDVISGLEKVDQNTQINLEVPGIKANNEFEKEIMDSWRKNSEHALRIGLNDNFYEAGGNSLLIAKVASHLSKIYPGKIAVTDFFGFPTVAKLAAILKQRVMGSASELDSVELINGLIDVNGKNKNIWNITISKKQLDSIFEDQYGVKKVEILVLTCYALLINKMSIQKEITIYLARDSQNTFLPCHINLSKCNSFFQLMENIQGIVKRSTHTENIIIEEANIKLKQRKDQMIFMLTPQSYQALHNHHIARIFDCTIFFNYDQNINLQFSITGLLKKEAAQVLVNSFITLINKLTDYSKSTVPQ